MERCNLLRWSQVNNSFHRVNLPIPFVKGQPVGYQDMDVEQLRRFIRFVYKTCLKTPLPVGSEEILVEKPSWWVDSVAFSKHMVVFNAETCEDVKRQLLRLLRSCYNYHGLSALLAFGGTLASGNHKWRVGDSVSDGYLIPSPTGLPSPFALIPKIALTYDADEEEDDEVLNVYPEVVKWKTTIQKRNGRKRRASKSSNNYQRRKRPSRSKKVPLSPHVDITPRSCKYCKVYFDKGDVCDEHQDQCMSGPFSSHFRDQTNFMKALDMRRILEVDPVSSLFSFKPLQFKLREIFSIDTPNPVILDKLTLANVPSDIRLTPDAKEILSKNTKN